MVRIALVLVLVSLAGCTHTSALGGEGSDSRERLNGLAPDRPVEVTLVSGEVIRARGVHVAEDVTTWFDRDTGSIGEAPTREIARVTYAHHGRGAADGAMVGAASLGVLGSFFLMGTFQDTQGSTLQGAVVGAGVFAIPGALIGAAAGGATGSDRVYLVSPAYRPPDDG